MKELVIVKFFINLKTFFMKLPNWRTGGLGVGNKQLKTDPETQRVAQLMLRCASRGKSNLPFCGVIYISRPGNRG